MNTPLDESLHSFLIRHQLAYTHKFDPKGVISSNGGWKRIPYAHHEVTKLFEKYSDLFLLEAIDVDIQLGERNHQFFDEPDSYCLSIHMTFFQGFQNRYISNGQLPITYCPDCIKEMIRENGFGYFRKNWGRESWCDNHDIAYNQF
ncbi:hypothetical protein AB6E21_10980 [Photobacterium swingsii]|uniref:hypothetical protein n=1 Tax=Photobacterium swingsii TaxID=680026 RepID=UPI00354C87B1